MGAFFGPLSGMAGLMANSRDQGTREAQLQQIAQLKAQGLLEENAAGSMNLQEAIRQRDAKAKILADPNTPPEVKQALLLGTDPTAAMKQVQADKQGKIEALLLSVQDPKVRQAIWSAAQTQDPSLTVTPTIAKILGIGSTDAEARDAYYKARTEQVQILNKMMKDPAMRAMVLRAMGSSALAPDAGGGDAGTGGGDADFEEVP